ncbi:MAG: DUF2089 family protein [Actinomycetota bacterium]
MALYPLSTKDPASGEEFIVTRLECPDSGGARRSIQPWLDGKVTGERLDFVGLLLKHRNNLQKLASELGVAYNTARSRLDDIVGAIGGTAEPEPEVDGGREEILSKLADKEITFEEAMEQLKGRRGS